MTLLSRCGKAKTVTLCLQLLLFCAIATGAAEKSAAPAEEWQFFRVNAQYRGAVKKGFGNIGCAIAWFKDLPANQVQVILHVCALHPEKKDEKYSFRLNLVLQRQAGKYSLAREIYADFSGINGERQNQIRQLSALLAYMRDFAAEGQLLTSIDSCGAELVLNQQKATRSNVVEIDCSWTGRKDFAGKFFFNQLADAKLRLQKFRFKSAKLSVSLALDTSEAITRDFAHRTPFHEVVFK